jgi:uncharacterized protein involved in exopolysaccharide biosynthesis
LNDLRQKMGGLKGEMGNLSANPSPLAEQIDEQVVADRAELVPLQDEQTRDQALVNSLSNELHRLEQADLDLRTVENRIDAMNTVLQTIQGRYNKARAEEELDRARQVSVVPAAKAVAADKPHAPRPLIYTGAGILAGILLAGGVLLFSAVNNSRLNVERSVERLIGLPVLAALPDFRSQQRLALPAPKTG